MQTLMTISQASGIDITKKAKELYGVSTLDDMEQYNELKEIAING